MMCLAYICDLLFGSILDALLITKNLSMKTRKKILYCYIISTLMYAAETWVINAADWKKIEAFEMWALRKMMKISYKEHMTNVEVLKRANHKRSLKNEIMLRKTKYLGHALRKNGMQRGLLESDVVGGRGRGRPRHTWLHNIRKEMGMSYVDLVRAADDRQSFRLRTEEIFRS